MTFDTVVNTDFKSVALYLDRHPGIPVSQTGDDNTVLSTNISYTDSSQ